MIKLCGWWKREEGRIVKCDKPKGHAGECHYVPTSRPAGES